jgi:uncharacterized protein YacL
MNISLAFLRTFFVILSMLFMTMFMVTLPSGSVTENAFIGVGVGFLFGLLLIAFDTLFRRFNLRAFNIAIIGIFIGYLMGQALVLVFKAVLDISHMKMAMQVQTIELMEIGLFLFGIYLGTIMTLKAADELYISIPFVKFTPTMQKKKDLLIDSSVLTDARIIDVATTGLFDFQLIIPRYIVKELYAQSEVGDEPNRNKARRSLETIRKLEELPNLGLRLNDTDFPEVKDPFGKLTRLGRLLDANILTADISRIQMSVVEGIKIINIHSLSNALKPLMQTGESMKIKIQRLGKEPNQGVGYLEDGTMVVVNGAGDFIGQNIDVQVLSVKHTTSGRMVFCNTLEEEALQQGENSEL